MQSVQASSSPKLSVLLPFCSEQESLNEAIESIVRQSFTDWEMILINNSGDVAAEDVARLWTRSDARIRMIRVEKCGIAFALNAGLKEVKSPLIARMDADDVSLPGRFARQLEVLEQHPELAVVASQTRFESNMPKNEGFHRFVDWQNSILSPEQHRLQRFVESPLAHPTVMFRTSLIKQYGMYNEGAVPEDYELWLRWMDAGELILKMDEPLLIWKDHASRLTRTHPNYEKEAFYQVKCHYLARWIRQHLPKEKKIVVCGSSRIGRKRAAMLEAEGVAIFGFTDVRKRPNREVNFIPIPALTDPKPWFLVNFIARRGVGVQIRTHFSSLGFVEGRDFILAG